MSDNYHNSITHENERKTLTVIILTIITMSAEILYGYYTNSMALLADGYHMGTHAIALGLAYIAYILIRKFKDSPCFPNGTDKIGTLAAYTSSLILGFTGIWIIFEAFCRLIDPIQIQFDEALIVAVIGFFINLVCLCVMEHSHTCHCCADVNTEDKHEEKEDYNFKAAYFHILSDILTSVFAIAALLISKYFNIFYFDSIIGILGGILILKWAVDLITKTVKILIDMKFSIHNN